MAFANFKIKWETRPCAFHHGDCKIENGFWHMWYEPKSGIVVGIVEDERGEVNEVKCDNIIFLDVEEKFAEYDWLFAKSKAFDKIREHQKECGFV